MKEKRKFNLDICALRFYDAHRPRIKPCSGPIKLVGYLPLCKRHRLIVEAIKADAIKAGTYEGGHSRHPVHHGRTAA